MTLRTSRRTLLRAAAAAAVAPGAVMAQAWPNRPIRLICPWTAGGSIDGVMRAMGTVVGRVLNTTVVVENKAGASGVLGATELARARPDGYLLSQIPPATFSLPHMQKVQFDPLTDITYIIGLAGSTNCLVARSDGPVKSIRELVEFSRANPEGFTYSSAGIGSFGNLAAEDLAQKAGIRLRHVPYKGDADGMQAVLGGHVMAVSSSTSWAAHVDAGTFRILCNYGNTRIKRWPNAPTLREEGYETAFTDSPYGIGGPKGMDADITLRIHDAFKQALSDPSVATLLERNDMPVIYQDTATFTKYARDTLAVRRKVIERLGLAI
jgi:tripartite-type tricarboxylate transporter receptor subunit TctC